MKKTTKPKKRCRLNTKSVYACCVSRMAVAEVSLRPEVSRAMDRLASRLRFRQQMIREAVVAGNDVVAEIKKQIARREAQR